MGTPAVLHRLPPRSAARATFDFVQACPNLQTLGLTCARDARVTLKLDVAAIRQGLLSEEYLLQQYTEYLGHFPPPQDIFLEP